LCKQFFDIDIFPPLISFISESFNTAAADCSAFTAPFVAKLRRLDSVAKTEADKRKETNSVLWNTSYIMYFVYSKGITVLQTINTLELYVIQTTFLNNNKSNWIDF
jgi:hypothetical protein